MRAYIHVLFLPSLIERIKCKETVLFIIFQKLHDENKVMIADGKVHMVIS